VGGGEGDAGARTGGRASSMGWVGVQRAAVTPSRLRGRVGERGRQGYAATYRFPQRRFSSVRPAPVEASRHRGRSKEKRADRAT
jgi:hypothetical protein